MVENSSFDNFSVNFFISSEMESPLESHSQNPLLVRFLVHISEEQVSLLKTFVHYVSIFVLFNFKVLFDHRWNPKIAAVNSFVFKAFKVFNFFTGK